MRIVLNFTENCFLNEIYRSISKNIIAITYLKCISFGNTLLEYYDEVFFDV